MTNLSISSGHVSSATGIRPSIRSLTVILAVAGLLVVLPLATSLSKTILSTPGAPAIAAALPVQSQTSTFYLHGTGPANNPPTLFLNTTAPTAITEKYKDSASISRNSGNPWKEVGTWNATAGMTTGPLTSLSDLHVWLGLKNSDDQGTYFDLLVEAYKNNTLLASGQSLCIQGITRNPASAKEVTLGFAEFSATTFNGTSDVLKLKISTRVGTTAAGASCGGHSNAVGLRLYFDAVSRAARFTAIQGSGDTTPPVLVVEQPANDLITTANQINVSGTFSDQSPTTIIVNGITASVVGNSFSASVPLVEGSNELSVVAEDSSGNQSQATRVVIRDTTAPVITLASEYEITANSVFLVTGTVAEPHLATVTVAGAAATVSGAGFSASVTLVEGENSFLVVATDAAGNHSEVSQLVTRDTVAPTLNVTDPVDQSVFNITLTSVLGSVTDNTHVTVLVNNAHMSLDGDTFGGQIDLVEGINELHIVATDGSGNTTEVIRTVTADATDPVISDLTPVDGSIIEGTSATVQGRVVDVTAVTVKVGAVTANVAAGGLFTASSVPIAEGKNEFVITALDVAGNRNETELVLVGKDMTAPAAPAVFPIQSPTRLGFQSIEGRAEPGTKIRITGGTEAAEADAAFGSGLFMANVNLAAGTNALSLTAADAEGNISPAVLLSITSDPNVDLAPDGQPAWITVATGDAQRGLVSVELPRPVIAIVRDRSGNAVSNTTVRFTLTHGGGLFTNGSSIADVQTDDHGYASARYVSGAAPGIQLIRADFAGNVFAPTTFMAEALISAPGGTTSVSGTVRDVNLRALPNVLVRISGQQTRTGADGRFRIENVPAGPHQILELIGRDQITLPGRWPNISYDIDVLPGIDNNLGRQLFLPKVNDGIQIPLDANNVVTQDTSTQLYVAGGEPLIVITARAGTQVTFPPDVTDKRLSVTRIPANRVPMPLEDGMASNLFISVQPSGAIFDQPLEVSFPNLDQLPPNSEVKLMSFDHDAGRYVQVGTGTVSADGRSVSSDPGSGIRVGAWHAPPPPPRPRPGGGNPPSEFTVLSQIQVKDNPELEVVHIDDVLVQAGGFRGIVLTERAQWHHVDTLAARVRGTQSPNNPQPIAVDAEVQKTIPDFTLEEVSFEENYPLKSDDGATEYRSPHWTKPATPNPDYKGEPIAYKTGSSEKIKVAAKFSIGVEVTNGKLLRVKADGNDPYELDAAVAELKREGNTTSVVLKGTLVRTAFAADKLDYFESMDFKWEVSRDGGTVWFPAGTSKNQLYVTGGRPANPLHSLVHIATVNLRGLTKSQKTEIVEKIWLEFDDLDVRKVDGSLLKYWDAISGVSCPPAPATCNAEFFTTAGLLKNGDGRCGAWKWFFNDALKVQNVTDGKPSEITPKPESGYDAKESLILVGPGNWVIGTDECPTGFFDTPAQGNAHPASAKFIDHAVVVYGSEEIFDPSYGNRFPGGLKAWENGSLHGRSYQRRNGTNPDGTPRFRCKFKLNDTTRADTDMAVSVP